MGTIMPNRGKESRGRLNHLAARAELPLVRHLLKARRAGVLTVAAAVGVLATAGPALADVTVNPPTAPQGTGSDLTFHVTNPDRSPITRVRLVLPPDSPIAEVYPLSVPDWAPQITEQKLQAPLDTIHGGAPATAATKDITWTAVGGNSIAPGASADLSVSLGPLPTLSQMQFSVVPTYADGHAGAPMPAVLKLTPATAEEQAAGHAGHGTAADGTDGTGATDPEAAQFAQIVAQAQHGPSVLSVAGWIVAALIGAGAIVVVLRSRRKATPAEPDEDQATDSDEPEETKESVGAGAGKTRVSSWRYQDGPE